MKTFYKIENEQAQVGQGTKVPESFIEYIVGQEPIELTEALNKEQNEKEEQALKLEQSRARDEAMLTGATYMLKATAYQISFTKDDGDGVVQVKSAFEMGLTNTIIKFDCGTMMPIDSSEFSDFGVWFVTERNKFFKVE